MTQPPDLISLVLTLRPVDPPPDRPAPPWWGRATHALLLDVTRKYDADLADELHEGSDLRPFTVSNLLGKFPERRLDPAGVYVLRLTAFQPALSAVLLEAASSGTLAPGNNIELDYFFFKIEEVTWNAEEHPWAGAVRFPELAGATLLELDAPPRRVTLQFSSPTTFKSGGRHIPVPMPDLVFASLLERWNAYSPVSFPDETRRFAAQCLAISRYQLASRAVPMKGGGLRVGGAGQVTYTSLNYDRYWMSVIHTLSAFALYSGVGGGTGLGLGQARRVLTR